jgi:hypothetical protein
VLTPPGVLRDAGKQKPVQGLEQLQTTTQELVKQVDGITPRPCAVRLNVWTNTMGQPVLNISVLPRLGSTQNDVP